MTGRLDSQIIYLGNVQKGDEIRIKMQLKQDNGMSGVVRLTAAELDEEVMEELAQRMQEKCMETYQCQRKSSKWNDPCTGRSDVIFLNSIR
mgnify:CR=1 FL=1